MHNHTLPSHHPVALQQFVMPLYCYLQTAISNVFPPRVLSLLLLSTIPHIPFFTTVTTPFQSHFIFISYSYVHRLGVQTFRREADRFWILAAHPEQNLLAAGAYVLHFPS